MKKLISLAITLFITLPVKSEVRVVYAENNPNELNVQNVKEIQNSYETQISEMEIKHKQEKADIRTVSALEIEAEQEKAKKELDEQKRALDKEQAEVARLKRLDEERKRRDQQVAQVNKDYKLSVDLTKKVITHIGLVPASLPARSSQAFDANLAASFNTLIPLDWKVYVHQSIGENVKVSWQSVNENWVATLYKIGVQYDYKFDINWNERWVLVNKNDMRFASAEAESPKIEVMGTNVEVGAEGYMLIDGNIMKVRRSN
ncbi:hypothetical protein [Cellvibrio sp. QJXJ]|uniref:hypothetical protein n=1 Tax=Cellvibrio sp. QJXJ TaxID=2964606 RepID=UPI0021C40205|nr:hypothetical protein [Cellvibrio sp. QJXJ]UUA75134.1 hypothetical protein NNX04_22010 [Cellvibrio sp. QJXJ]